ncbi:MAG: carbohydrate kinase family protein, partial [Anaerolineae bacterium]|nr:carbohydrate kinase family protein [Anaerolineae bacterium]
IGRHVGWLPGGTVPNFACAASCLGLRTCFLGTVGDDAPGRLVVEDFHRFGVNTDHLTTLPGTPTYYTVILLPPGGERAIVVVPTYPDDTPLTYKEQTCVASARAVYIMTGNVERFEALAAAARAGGALVMVDVEPTLALDMTRLKRILSATDVASFNRAGLESATGRPATDLVKTARQMLDLNPQVVVVTLGREGCLAVTADDEVRCPGFETEVVDTTGAGDCFNAAFLTGYLSGWSLERMANFGNAAAALSVTKLGPRAGIPTRKQALKFLTDRDQA